ncbi:MAG: hypothetical protein JHC87_06795 [Thermoleophilaceae bacterium]|nr:hypothetical protein [Thermoleophilaceae bacterium]
MTQHKAGPARNEYTPLTRAERLANLLPNPEVAEEERKAEIERVRGMSYTERGKELVQVMRLAQVINRTTGRYNDEELVGSLPRPLNEAKRQDSQAA